MQNEDVYDLVRAVVSPYKEGFPDLTQAELADIFEELYEGPLKDFLFPHPSEEMLIGAVPFLDERYIEIHVFSSVSSMWKLTELLKSVQKYLFENYDIDYLEGPTIHKGFIRIGKSCGWKWVETRSDDAFDDEGKICDQYILRCYRGDI